MSYMRRTQEKNIDTNHDLSLHKADRPRDDELKFKDLPIDPMALTPLLINFGLVSKTVAQH